MSTFTGFFDEIPWISADRFEDVNIISSKLLFLSHCHFDHMIGLYEINRSAPYKEHGPIYTSPISSVFLKKQFPHLKNVHTLEINCPTELSYTVEDTTFVLVVTALSAQHCPGSIMFLYETVNASILYTGDFRLAVSDLEKNRLLKDRNIDCVYLDSTFLNKRYQYFPTQFESVKEICKIISEWLEKSHSNKVILELPGQYGSELLFMEIEGKLKQQIYVHPQQYEKYIYFPQMDRCISNKANECRIITRFKRESKIYDKNVCTVIPSAMYWIGWCPNKSIIKTEKNDVFRVAYSSHSSCAELKDFLHYIKPKKVKLNVLPDSDSDRLRMIALLDEIYSYEKFSTKTKKENNQKPLHTPSFSNIFFRKPRKHSLASIDSQPLTKRSRLSHENDDNNSNDNI